MHAFRLLCYGTLPNFMNEYSGILCSHFQSFTDSPNNSFHVGDGLEANMI